MERCGDASTGKQQPRSGVTFVICRSVSLGSPSERSLQVVVLLGKLLQSLLQPHALLPFCLEGLLPSLAVRLGQRQEVPAGLHVTETALATLKKAQKGSWGRSSNLARLYPSVRLEDKVAFFFFYSIGTLSNLRWSWRWRWFGTVWLSRSPDGFFPQPLQSDANCPVQTRTWGQDQDQDI